MLSRLLHIARGKNADYDLLPTSDRPLRRQQRYSGSPTRYAPRWRGWRRYVFKTFLVLSASIAVITLLLRYSPYTPWILRTKSVALIFAPKPLPPLYEEFIEAEMAMPQHHVKDPFANGQKYFWVASHTQCEFCRDHRNNSL